MVQTCKASDSCSYVMLYRLPSTAGTRLPEADNSGSPVS